MEPKTDMNPKTVQTALYMIAFTLLIAGAVGYYYHYKNTGSVVFSRKIESTYPPPKDKGANGKETAYNGDSITWYADGSIDIAQTFDQKEKRDLANWHKARLDTIDNIQFRIVRQLDRYDKAEKNRFLTYLEKDTARNLGVLYNALQTERITHEQQLKELEK